MVYPGIVVCNGVPRHFPRARISVLCCAVAKEHVTAVVAAALGDVCGVQPPTTRHAYTRVVRYVRMS